MEKKKIMDDEQIIYQVYNLNWLLPKNIQEEAIRILSELPNDKVHFLIPKYGKECWENGVSILARIGYPRNEKALPLLARLLQDRNWPGALEAIEIFRSVGKQISVPFIEKECEQALSCQDADWLEHLYWACQSLNIQADDFENADSFEEMKQKGEEL